MKLSGREILSKETANYADYNTFKEYDMVCCGWMDFHSDEDYGCTKERPMFKIDVQWVNLEDEQPVLVYTNDGKFWSFEEVEADKSYIFNGYHPHALIPISKLRLLPKYTKKLIGSPIWKQMIKLGEVPTTPKVLWKWGNAYE